MKKVFFLLFLLYAVLTGEEKVSSGLNEKEIEEKRSVKSYPVRFVDIEVVRQAIREVIGRDSGIIVQPATRTIFVSATDSEHILLEALLSEIDKPVPNIQIDVIFKETGYQVDSSFKSGASGTLNIKKGNVNVEKITITPSASLSSVRHGSDTKQTIVVRSGARASIFIGKEVPLIEWLVDLSKKWGYIQPVQQNFTYKQIGVWLTVQPTVIGNGPLVNVKLTPQLSGIMENDQPFTINYQNVSTEVIVRDGETINLGGLVKQDEFYTTLFLRGSREKNSSVLDILLTLRILPLHP